MGCGCTSNCGKNAEEISEFHNDSNIVRINDIISNNKKLLSSIIKLQSYYRGIKARLKFQSRLNEISELLNNDEQQDKSQFIIILDDELNSLLNSYPPLNDGIQVEIISPIEYPSKNTIYCGEWDKERNIRHGRGILIWPEGSKYLGYWVNDKANIKGKLIHNDGDIYDGEWSDDKPNGKGIYIHKDGTVYEGEWRNDKQEGLGKEKWADGACYEGQYKDGKKNGKGKFHWADGSYYEGTFIDNDISGKGIYIFNDKKRYEGEWDKNKLNGYGVFTWPDGRRYEGNYKDDKKEGYGTFEWDGGKKYVGNWKKGKQHGEGLLYSVKNKTWRKGIWDNAKRIKWIK
jgi:hypothetical protein